MAEPNFYVLAYDVVDDKRRLKVAKMLERVGDRVQYSVFEVYLTSPELDKLIKRLGKVLNADEDSLRVYALCGGCRGRVQTVGKAAVTPPPGVRII